MLNNNDFHKGEILIPLHQLEAAYSEFYYPALHELKPEKNNYILFEYGKN